MTGPRAEVVTKLSPWSVSDTVARLKAVAEARGIKLLEIIDLTSAAKAVGVETMPPLTYIRMLPRLGRTARLFCSASSLIRNQKFRSLPEAANGSVDAQPIDSTILPLGCPTIAASYAERA
jgi:hypothetical protein